MKKIILFSLLLLSNLCFSQVTLISDDFNRASLGADYTNYGTTGTSTIVSNKLQLSGGTSGIADRVMMTSYSSTQKSLTITATITPTANGNGMKFVLLTPNNTPVGLGGVSGLSLTFDCNSTLSKRGFLRIKTVANGGEALKCSTATGLTYTNSTQPIDITIIIRTDSVSMSATNTVTSQTVSTSFCDSSVITLKRWNFGYARNGGTVLIDNPLVVSDTKDTTSLAVISHSMGAGANATDKRDAWVYLLSDSLVDGVNNFSGGGSTIQDAFDNVACEYDKFYSPYTIVHLGTNDAGVLVSDTVFNQILDSIISRILARGSIPILCTEIPSNNAARNIIIQSYNAKVWAKSGTYLIIDFWALMVSGGVLNPLYSAGDALPHPNTLGHFNMYGYARAQTVGILNYK